MPDPEMSAMTADSSTGASNNIDLGQSLAGFGAQADDHNQKESKSKGPNPQQVMEFVEENPEMLAI